MKEYCENRRTLILTKLWDLMAYFYGSPGMCKSLLYSTRIKITVDDNNIQDAYRVFQKADTFFCDNFDNYIPILTISTVRTRNSLYKA